MAKPSNNIPGIIGKLNVDKKTIGIAVPEPYRLLVEARLEELAKYTGIKFTFQEALKMSLAYFFPVPEFELQTEIFVEEFLGNPHDGKAPTIGERIDPSMLKPLYVERRTKAEKEAMASKVYEQLHGKVEEICKSSAEQFSSKRRLVFGED
jgi:hypothetical protein